MDINSDRMGEILVISPKIRLDAYGASKLDDFIKSNLKDEDHLVILNLEEVTYLSSGGIRTFLESHRILTDKGGTLILCNVKKYPREVLEMAGFDQVFPLYNNLDEAMDSCIKPQEYSVSDEEYLMRYEDDILSIKTLKVTSKDSSLKVLGDVKSVLTASITSKDVYSRKFSETEYSIGLGGLGEYITDYIGIMGEMMTIGGTMVWLPTDEHDTPDFLIPEKDTGKITIHTGFNVALDGEFNDIIMVEAKTDAGFSVDNLYDSLFKISQKKTSFKGIISLAMQADIKDFYSSGVNISPIEDLAPKNHEMITHEDNIGSWMNINTTGKYQGETMVSFGVGVDLNSDLSLFDENALGSLFYLHPANIGDKTMLLHNHAVVFKHLPIYETSDLDGRIREIVNSGNFLDMRHLLDNTRIERAIIGISYIQDIIFEDGIIL